MDAQNGCIENAGGSGCTDIGREKKLLHRSYGGGNCKRTKSIARVLILKERGKMQGTTLGIGQVGSSLNLHVSWKTPPAVYRYMRNGNRIVMSAGMKGNKPRIVKLRQEEVARVLPWTGSGEQRLQKLGGPSTWMARVALSLAGSLVLFQYNTMAAAMASLFWAWDPIWSTAFANTALRFQYPYAGVWKARVLYAEIVKPVPKSQNLDVFEELFDSQPVARPSLRLVIGDDSAASVEMKVGIPGKRYKVEVGEPVEVLVLSDNRSLSRFIAVHDIFLPNVGIWLTEQPCIERPVFEGISERFSSPSMQPISEVLKRPSVGDRNSLSRDEVIEVGLPQSRFVTETVSAEPIEVRRPQKIQLSDEKFESIMDEDQKLRAVRRPKQTQAFDEKLKKTTEQEDMFRSPRQLRAMRTFVGERERGKDENPGPSGQPRQLEVFEGNTAKSWDQEKGDPSPRQPKQFQDSVKNFESNWNQDNRFRLSRQTEKVEALDANQTITQERGEEIYPSDQRSQIQASDADVENTQEEEEALKMPSRRTQTFKGTFKNRVDVEEVYRPPRQLRREQVYKADFESKWKQGQDRFSSVQPKEVQPLSKDSRRIREPGKRFRPSRQPPVAQTSEEDVESVEELDRELNYSREPMQMERMDDDFDNLRQFDDDLRSWRQQKSKQTVARSLEYGWDKNDEGVRTSRKPRQILSREQSSEGIEVQDEDVQSRGKSMLNANVECTREQDDDVQSRGNSRFNGYSEGIDLRDEELRFRQPGELQMLDEKLGREGQEGRRTSSSSQRTQAQEFNRNRDSTWEQGKCINSSLQPNWALPSDELSD